MNTLSGYYWHHSQSIIITNPHNIILHVKNGNIYDQDGINVCSQLSNVVSISDIYSDMGPFEAITTDGKVYTCDRIENSNNFYASHIYQLKNIVSMYRYGTDYYAPVYLDINNKFHIFVENKYIEFNPQVQVSTYIRSRKYGDYLVYNDTQGNVYEYRIGEYSINYNIYDLKDVLQVVSDSIFIHADGTISILNGINNGISGIINIETLRQWNNGNIRNHSLLEPVKIKSLRHIVYGHTNQKDMTVFLDMEGNVYRSRYIYIRNSIQEDIDSIPLYLEENKNKPGNHLVDFVVKTAYTNICKVKVIGINTLLLQNKDGNISMKNL